MAHVPPSKEDYEDRFQAHFKRQQEARAKLAELPDFHNRLTNLKAWQDHITKDMPPPEIHGVDGLPNYVALQWPESTVSEGRGQNHAYSSRFWAFGTTFQRCFKAPLPTGIQTP